MHPQCVGRHGEERVCPPGEAYRFADHCRACYVYDRQEWVPIRPPFPCRHKGGETRRALCPTCFGKVELRVFACGVHGECTAAKRADGVRGCCAGCADYDPEPPNPTPTAAVPPP